MNDGTNDFNADGFASVGQPGDAAGAAAGAAPVTAFCQQCGRPLQGAAVRTVGSAVFCEPCLEARVAGVGGAPPAYVPVAAFAAIPNPATAAVLGFIPGVGAMYNEQYAKGLVHLMVFAVLVSLSHAAGIFLLFVFGWMGYMVIEAHHTARARRDGTPLPNPFGLNEAAERFGFGKAWPSGARPDVRPDVRPDAVGGVVPPVYTTGAGVRTGAASQAAAGWGPPETSAPGWAPPYGASVPPYGASIPPAYGASVPPAYGAPVPPRAQSYQAVPLYQAVPPYQATPAYAVPEVAGLTPRSNFPIGAGFLIGLGVFFLLATTGWFQGVRPQLVLAVALILLAGWIFARRMLDAAVAAPYSANLRLLRALRPTVWILLVGILFLLQDLGVVDLARSWPAFLILAGVMTSFERMAQNSAAAAYRAAPVQGVGMAGESGGGSAGSGGSAETTVTDGSTSHNTQGGL